MGEQLKKQVYLNIYKNNADMHIQTTPTLRKESKDPLDMLSSIIIMVLPGERQRHTKENISKLRRGKMEAIHQSKIKEDGQPRRGGRD